MDGTILPGITRDSVLALAQSHSIDSPLPGISPSIKLHTHERILTMSEVKAFSESHKLLEAFGVGTAVIVAPVGRIGWKGDDFLLPEHAGGLGPVGAALSDRIIAIQEGRFPWRNWSQICQ